MAEPSQSWTDIDTILIHGIITTLHGKLVKLYNRTALSLVIVASPARLFLVSTLGKTEEICLTYQ
jgi:hypothetical protein